MNEKYKSKYERWKPIIDEYLKEYNDLYGDGVFSQDMENVIIKTPEGDHFILKQWFENGKYPVDEKTSVNIREYIDGLMKKSGMSKIVN